MPQTPQNTIDCPFHEAHVKLGSICAFYNAPLPFGDTVELHKMLSFLREGPHTKIIPFECGCNKHFFPMVASKLCKAPLAFFAEDLGMLDTRGRYCRLVMKSDPTPEAVSRICRDTWKYIFADDTPILIRARIVKSLVDFVDSCETEELRNNDFWYTLCNLLVRVEALVDTDRQLKEPDELINEPVNRFAEAVIDMWCRLSKYGSHHDVKGKVCEYASRLLQLLHDAQLTLGEGIRRWEELIFSMKLDTVDPMTGDDIPRPLNLQTGLWNAEVVYRRLAYHPSIMNMDVPRRHFEEKMNYVVPYLRGLSSAPRRGLVHSSYQQATFLLKNQSKSLQGKVCNICKRSNRGFMIELDCAKLLDIKCDGDGKLIRGATVDGWPRRVARIEIDGQPVDVETVKIDYQYPNMTRSKKDNLVIDCYVSRAWHCEPKDGVNRCGLALLASKELPVPESWQEYVVNLENNGRYR